jgi:NAD(P)-dependent dehydrogenase (short-subunit alcohol dehydrogenase family)
MLIEPGQVAVVTGAAAGIGYALTAALVARGVEVVMADVEESALADAATRVRPLSPPLTVVCDVSDSAAMDRLRDATLSAHGRIDLVFNNAGISLRFEPMWECPKENWDWLLGVNLGGVINGIRSFVPFLVDQGRGHVVNTASMAGVLVIPYNGMYNASKHAVVSLTETLAAEFALVAPGVHASVICPGLVPTRIGESERNRPASARLGTESEEADPAEGDARRLRAQASSSAISAEALAERSLAAVEQDLVYIFPNPGAGAATSARFDAIRRDLTASEKIIARIG